MSDPRHNATPNLASARRWIDVAVSMSGDDRDDHMTAHYVFARKVLREPRFDALQLAARFRTIPLTRQAANLLLAEWWSCDVCGREVGGGTTVCDECNQGGTHAASAA